MTLTELHERIVETLNLEVITPKSLVVCVNNCFADLLSRGYRDFQEDKITSINDVALDTLEFPYSFDVPNLFRRLQYLKGIGEGFTMNAERIILSSASYKGRVDENGLQRISFRELLSPYAFYLINDKVYLDGAIGARPISEIHLGYYKRLTKMDIDSPLETEVPIREELEDALVLYGVYFYTMRMKIDVELTKEQLNRYKYFVEDILNDLDSEDMFIARNTINAFNIYDG